MERLTIRWQLRIWTKFLTKRCNLIEITKLRLQDKDNQKVQKEMLSLHLLHFCLQIVCIIPLRIYSGSWFRKTRVSDPDPHGSALIWLAVSGSGSRRAKMTHKNRKKSRIFMFLSTGCSLLRAEGFSCSLGVLYGRPGISKLQFLIKKI